jgi:hypothetical protein
VGYNLGSTPIELTFTSSTSVSFEFSSSVADYFIATIYGYKLTPATNYENGGLGGYA